MTTPESNPNSPDSRPWLLAATPEELAQEFSAMGEKPFRAKQVLNWLYRKRVCDVAKMTDLSAGLRQRLAEHFRLPNAAVVASEADHESTTKVALRYPDGSVIESVLMLEPKRDAEEGDELRRTACISTQAGCAMGCRFCASGQLGLKRHLAGAEIVEQFYAIANLLPAEQWLTNVVYMGMGEPLHNWEGFMRSLRALVSDWGFNMSPRRITVSTVGFPRRIRDLAASGIPVNLAVSLHAPNDEIRDRLIPTNEAYGGIEEILSAAADYFKGTGRQVTFEYTVVKGTNDRPEHAKELASVVRRFLPGANINLIPMNPVRDTGLFPPENIDVEIFSKILDEAGHSVHTRKKKGRSVSAACGQLRLRVEQGAAG